MPRRPPARNVLPRRKGDLDERSEAASSCRDFSAVASPGCALDHGLEVEDREERGSSRDHHSRDRDRGTRDRPRWTEGRGAEGQWGERGNMRGGERVRERGGDVNTAAAAAAVLPPRRHHRESLYAPPRHWRPPPVQEEEEEGYSIALPPARWKRENEDKIEAVMENAVHLQFPQRSPFPFGDRYVPKLLVGCWSDADNPKPIPKVLHALDKDVLTRSNAQPMVEKLHQHGASAAFGVLVERNDLGEVVESEMPEVMVQYQYPGDDFPRESRYKAQDLSSAFRVAVEGTRRCAEQYFERGGRLPQTEDEWEENDRERLAFLRWTKGKGKWGGGEESDSVPFAERSLRRGREVSGRRGDYVDWSRADDRKGREEERARIRTARAWGDGPRGSGRVEGRWSGESGWERETQRARERQQERDRERDCAKTDEPYQDMMRASASSFRNRERAPASSRPPPNRLDTDRERESEKEREVRKEVDSILEGWDDLMRALQPPPKNERLAGAEGGWGRHGHPQAPDALSPHSRPRPPPHRSDGRGDEIMAERRSVRVLSGETAAQRQPSRPFMSPKPSDRELAAMRAAAWDRRSGNPPSPPLSTPARPIPLRGNSTHAFMTPPPHPLLPFTLPPDVPPPPLLTMAFDRAPSESDESDYSSPDLGPLTHAEGPVNIQIPDCPEVRFKTGLALDEIADRLGDRFPDLPHNKNDRDLTVFGFILPSESRNKDSLLSVNVGFHPHLQWRPQWNSFLPHILRNGAVAVFSHCHDKKADLHFVLIRWTLQGWSDCRKTRSHHQIFHTALKLVVEKFEREVEEWERGGRQPSIMNWGRRSVRDFRCPLRPARGGKLEETSRFVADLSASLQDVEIAFATRKFVRPRNARQDEEEGPLGVFSKYESDEQQQKTAEEHTHFCAWSLPEDAEYRVQALIVDLCSMLAEVIPNASLFAYVRSVGRSSELPLGRYVASLHIEGINKKGAYEMCFQGEHVKEGKAIEKAVRKASDEIKRIRALGGIRDPS
uniref:Uncharacterized protein n=1 Tax=Chromera velia CCMP2878 TaxID=1169474 RepID=A0A0G4I083_9ALVE|eukprot:Cvel_9895.t1-p1 / transcript=Cvel_9895.t1 / gene=Cvel_9895 / organism=Chromera_velia_CCMP2878 / gene_product=hypothetical protein / transcript_product=hypothetical protein / location=Cvel_scaffold584:9121-13911(+) / protein_length=1007 / sequence_SO=supercontig / SO=protein_coding / is_pseudo=false